MDSKKVILVYKYGTMVELKAGGVQAMITAYYIRFGTIQYEVSHFCDGQQYCSFVNEEEFEVLSKEPKIGFTLKNK